MHDMDPATQVAFALHSDPGVYAVLLGSGVSTGAGVPTGWQVVLDLLGRLAAAEGEEPTRDQLEGWYAERYGEEPEYSSLLAKLGATQAERQALLRDYFEASEDERQQGVKVPSEAHHSLAQLVARGAVRVVLTTNFDRLTEHALDAAGVSYDVWSSPDDIQGGVPLAHGRTVVVKLHGDYRDTRIRNTLGELSTYHDELDNLLDRILDEFGLVVCGWSAMWDPALEAAIRRAPNRRYRMFWAARHGHLEEQAQRLVDQRKAVVVPIDDADGFFSQVAEKVAALDEAARPHPASTEAAVAMLKRHLPNSADRIRMTDLVMEEAHRVREFLAPEHFPVQVPPPDTTQVVRRVHHYEAAIETVVALFVHGAAWGDRPDHAQLWARALEVIANPDDGGGGGKVILLNLRRYPALVCFYAAGTAAVARGRWETLRAIALEPVWRDVNEEERLVAALHPHRVFDDADTVAQELAPGHPNSRRHTPISDHLHHHLRQPLAPIVDLDERYDEAFDRFELLAGLLLTDLRLQTKASDQVRPVPPGYVGRLKWRFQYQERIPPMEWTHEQADVLAPALFPETGEPRTRWDAACEAFTDLLEKARRNTF